MTMTGAMSGAATGSAKRTSGRGATGAGLVARAVLPAALAALAFGGCGGGGGSGDPAGSTVTSADASESQVLIEPASPEALAELCTRKQAVDEGPCACGTYHVVQIPPGWTVGGFLKDIEGDISVRDATTNDRVKLPEGGGSTIPAFVEDDPANISTQAAFTKVGVIAARGLGLTGAGEVIAVIDPGIDINHPALVGHLLLPGWDAIDGDDDPRDTGNGIDDNKNGRIDEGVGHGTFVASLIAAIAPNAKILPIRALDSDATGTASTVTSAFAMAVSRGAKIINFSGGLQREMRLIRQAVDGATSAGCTVIAAAGNRNVRDIDFPADL